MAPRSIKSDSIEVNITATGFPLNPLNNFIVVIVPDLPLMCLVKICIVCHKTVTYITYASAPLAATISGTRLPAEVGQTGCVRTSKPLLTKQEL